jgi:F-type H+-transporting ATPase subunit a
LSTTLALALISVVATQYLSVKALGAGGYISKFINIRNPINAFVGILELISEFAKLLSFSFRLFGNIFAGEVLLLVISFLVPIILPIPFLGLEIFVGFIQALVFTMLTTIFIVVATEKHH